MNKLWANLKSWYGVLLLVLLAGGVLWFILNGVTYINSLRTSWEAQRLQAQWEKPYREDKYGGKTPEETYDMFLSALRKGDMTLASKYFEIDGREDWGKTLETYEKSGNLGNLIVELENAKNKWTRENISEEKVVFKYDTYLEKNTTVGYEGQKLEFSKGTYTNSTEFYRYPNGIWKITKI